MIPKRFPPSTVPSAFTSNKLPSFAKPALALRFKKFLSRTLPSAVSINELFGPNTYPAPLRLAFKRLFPFNPRPNPRPNPKPKPLF